MSITITYNGKTISNVNLQSVRTEPIFDDTGTQVLFNRTTLVATGTISGTSDDSTNFIANMNEHRKKLSEPRGNLVVKSGGNDFINIVAPDSLDGPKPRRVEITDIVGIRFAFIHFEIEINLAECGEPEQSVASVLTHVFSVIHQLDRRFMTTRTITGTITADKSQAINLDSLRGLITPQVPTGFHRQSMRFALTTSSSRLEYEITDIEDYISAPKPAVRATGNYVLQMTKLGYWIQAMQLEIEGPKDQTKLKMLELAFVVILSRFSFRNIDLILRINIEEALYENVVKLSIAGMLRVSTAKGDTGVVPEISTMFKDLPGSESGETADLGPYGSALIQAAIVQFYDKCVSAGPAPAGATAGSGQATGPTISTSKAPEGGSIAGDTASDHQSDNQTTEDANPYTLYEESCAFNLENGLVILPATKQDQGARVYQLHVPFGVVIQSGRAIRIDKPPDVPVPAHTGLSIVRRRSVQPHAPQLSADNRTFLYSTSWRYEILVPFGGQSGAFKDQTPIDFKVPLNQITDGTSIIVTPTPEGYNLTSPDFGTPGGQ